MKKRKNDSSSGKGKRLDGAKGDNKNQSSEDGEITKEQALDILTKRQIQVLELIAKQKTAKEIASELDISPRTVEKHKEKIKGKLDLKKEWFTAYKWCVRNWNT